MTSQRLSRTNFKLLLVITQWYKLKSSKVLLAIVTIHGPGAMALWIVEPDTLKALHSSGIVGRLEPVGYKPK